MTEPINPKEIAKKIHNLKQAAGELQQDVQACPALTKNLQRILVSIKMLELNVSDLCELEAETLGNE